MSKTISPAMTGYAEAGVNREAGDALVDRIKLLTRGKHSKKVKTAVGGYAALYEIGKREYLAATTDGVGTKLKLAFSLGEHTTIGQDLVAMSVNDLICVGAEPMFFLDYFATGKLDVAQAEGVARHRCCLRCGAGGRRDCGDARILSGWRIRFGRICGRSGCYF